MAHRLFKEVQALLAVESLKVWTPMDQSDATARLVYVSAEVDDEFDGSCWIDDAMVRRYAALGADLDRFVSGDMITIGMDPDDKDIRHLWRVLTLPNMEFGPLGAEPRDQLFAFSEHFSTQMFSSPYKRGVGMF